MAKTKGPWVAGEFNEYGGYDMMFSGIQVGPAHLDGNRYGQSSCATIDEIGKARMVADAHLIAAAPELYEALKAVNELIAEGAMQGMRYDVDNWGERLFESQQATSAALAKARGEQHG